MAVTITRSNWVDDDGTGTTGTVINNAVKTDLYNQIDGALAKVAQLSGGNAFTGNQTITGNVTANGPNHTFVFATPNDVQVSIQNTSPAAAARAALFIGNDAVGYLTTLISTSSVYTGAPNESQLTGYGAGGLIVSTAAAGPLRFGTNSAERMRITATGELLFNATANPNATAALFAIDQGLHVLGVGIQNTSVQNGLYFLSFYNSAAAGIGTVAQTSATSVAYNTTSDQRLKTDDGFAADLTALRAVRVHDFTWTAEGIPDRGVFAQEAHAVFPRAVTPGTDDRTETGDLARPWGTDYSKFVPDLIVGWQQHDAALAELRAALATLKGSAHAQ